MEGAKEVAEEEMLVVDLAWDVEVAWTVEAWAEAWDARGWIDLEEWVTAELVEIKDLAIAIFRIGQIRCQCRTEESETNLGANHRWVQLHVEAWEEAWEDR